MVFGGRFCLGNKIRLHSHLGEGFAGDQAINKNRHMLFGICFVWVTVCYTVHFILSYGGNNQSILRLKMRLIYLEENVRRFMRAWELFLAGLEIFCVCLAGAKKGHLPYHRHL